MKTFNLNNSKEAIQAEIASLKSNYNDLHLDYQKTKGSYEKELNTIKDGYLALKQDLEAKHQAELEEKQREVAELQSQKANLEFGIRQTLKDLDDREYSLAQGEAELKHQIGLQQKQKRELESWAETLEAKQNVLENQTFHAKKLSQEVKSEKEALEKDKTTFGESVLKIERSLNDRAAEIIKREVQLTHEEASLKTREQITRQRSTELSKLTTQIMDKRYAFEQAYKEMGWTENVTKYGKSTKR